MNALLSIDYTVDFVADTGRLTTGQAGQAIETTLVDPYPTIYRSRGFCCLCH